MILFIQHPRDTILNRRKMKKLKKKYMYDQEQQPEQKPSNESFSLPNPIDDFWVNYENKGSPKPEVNYYFLRKKKIHLFILLN